jgi:hypothetical protein
MDVTKEDLRESREMIVDEMRRGFELMHRKQDVTNGRLLRLEDITARHDVLILGLNKDRDKDNEDSAIDDKRALTRRDLAVAVASIGALIAVLAWLGKLG